MKWNCGGPSEKKDGSERKKINQGIALKNAIPWFVIDKFCIRAAGVLRITRSGATIIWRNSCF
jgi:hypothetical protein